MERIKGFINVTEMLEEIGVDTFSWYSIRKSPKISVIGKYYDDKLFSFNYHGETYFYKDDICSISNPYNEVIVSFLAQDFGISYVDYDLAVLDRCYGNISKDFKRKGFRYLTGEEIIKEAFRCDSTSVEEFNNLENIWDAFEIRYHTHANKQELISGLVKKIVDLYLFDILLYQFDRQSFNWGVMESKDEIDIVPVFDNERILSSDDKFPISLRVDSEIAPIYLDSKELASGVAESPYQSIQKFLQSSSSDFSRLISEKLWIISEENLERIFSKIEEKTEYPMPTSQKEYYLKKFSTHLRKLKESLGISDCDIHLRGR